MACGKTSGKAFFGALFVRPRGIKERLGDMLAAIANIQAFVQGLDQEGFAKDAKTIRLERELERILKDL
jgi:uncharacterized protein with HEPN domain